MAPDVIDATSDDELSSVTTADKVDLSVRECSIGELAIDVSIEPAGDARLLPLPPDEVLTRRLARLALSEQMVSCRSIRSSENWRKHTPHARRGYDSVAEAAEATAIENDTVSLSVSSSTVLRELLYLYPPPRLCCREYERISGVQSIMFVLEVRAGGASSYAAPDACASRWRVNAAGGSCTASACMIFSKFPMGIPTGNLEKV